MKKLYINNKRITLKENTYFPFTQKVGNLDDVTIIGIPSSKTLLIPFSPDNDEIFGNVAEITRTVYGSTDNKIGISFNQFRKCSYTLYSDSDIVSEGIIKLMNITQEGYEVELYDRLIDILEQFEGDDETGAGYLNTLNLRIGGSTYNQPCTPSTIKYNLDYGVEPTPHINVRSHTFNPFKY